MIGVADIDHKALQRSVEGLVSEMLGRPMLGESDINSIRDEVAGGIADREPQQQLDHDLQRVEPTGEVVEMLAG